MLTFVTRRIVAAIPLLLGVAVLTFLLQRMIPGDPVDAILGEQSTAEQRDALRSQLGLDQPFLVQLKNVLIHLSRGNLGASLSDHRPVGPILLGKLSATFELSLAALALALLWGIPLGAWAGAHPGSRWDRAAFLAGLLGMSVPGIFLSPLLIYVFAVKLEWLPVSERGGLDHLVLPAVSLAIPLGAVIARITQTSVREVTELDYIRTARAKGLGEANVFFKHALFNALMPVVSIVGLQASAVLTGTVITETIFDWPGVGSLLYSAISKRDIPVVQGTVLLVAAIYIVVNLITDVAYGLLNPKVRVS